MESKCADNRLFNISGNQFSFSGSHATMFILKYAMLIGAFGLVEKQKLFSGFINLNSVQK